MGESTEKLFIQAPQQQTRERPSTASKIMMAMRSPSTLGSDGNWSPQSRHHSGRSHCRRASIKRPWTPEQDSMLRKLVMAHGRGHWSMVASALAGRSPKQCRERWINHLDPSISRREWTHEEDLQLIELHGELGNAWVRIAEHMPGRSDNSVKNRWHSSSTRKLVRERSEGSKSGSDSDCDISRSIRNPTADDGAVRASRSDSSATGSPRDSWASMDEDEYTLKKDGMDEFLAGINLDELPGQGDDCILE